MDEYLYNPTNWLPLGHPDALCLTLGDDLDAVQAVIETYKKTVEEVSVGFCPITRSLIPPGVSRRHLKHFVEPNELFGKPKPAQPPLLFLARLKMQGVLSLGRALLAQQSLFGLICKRIDAALHTLRKADDQGLYSRSDLNSLRLTFLDLLEEEEIGILFLCSNYSVPMSIVSHLQSLTFADLLEHDPRLVQILESSSHYKKLKEFHQTLQEENSATPPSSPSSASAAGLCEGMSGAHLLRWTRSTVAISWDYFRSVLDPTARTRKSSMSINGFVSSLTDIGHPPGHQADMEKHLRNGLSNGLKKSVPTGRSLPGPRSPDPSLKCRLHLVGATDYLLQLSDCGQTPRKARTGKMGSAYRTSLNKVKPHTMTSENVALRGPDSLVHISLLVQMWAGVLDSISQLDKPSGFSGRHVSSWATRLMVPVPICAHQDMEDWFHPTVPAGHTALVKEVLAVARDVLFPEKDDDARFTFSAGGLRNHTRALGIPVATRRALINLLENFFSILSNPLLFDVVLDYYDVLATLYRILTQERPEDSEWPPQHDYSRRLPTEGGVEPIHAMLESLSSALSLRQRRLYPETPLRDWSLDFRTNFIQIILSAEAALKASAGILRKVVRGDEHGRDTLGVVHHVTFEEGIRAISCDFIMETAGTGPSLAIFASDMAHLTHVPGYADFFHEGFHLIYNDMVRQQIRDTIALQVKDGLRPALNEESFSDLDTQLSEIFVHLMMHLFVFDGDWRLALRQHAISFSTSMASAFNNPADVRTSFLNNFGPISVASLVTNAASTRAKPGHIGMQSLGDHDWPVLSSAHGFFENVIDILRPVLTDHVWIFDSVDAPENGPAMKGSDRVIRGFMKRYADNLGFLQILWERAIFVYQMFVARVLQETGDHKHLGVKPPPDHAGAYDGLTYPPSCKRPCRDLKAADFKAFREIQRQLDAAIGATRNHGQPGYAPLIAATVLQGKAEKGYCLDATLVACRVLHRCMVDMEALLELKKKRIVRFLPRDGSTGAIALSPHVSYSPMMLDRTATQLFSCSPNARRIRTGLQIATLKTFWDMASRNRARRLISLLDKAGKARAAQRALASRKQKNAATASRKAKKSVKKRAKRSTPAVA
ncbi:hypothetical protein [Roseimicrobium sp. ORNL1]|uniref:hypothetical protein n=1 Tax=Roseimicrobium sp. ORNL1 TaxID=2711231 RepID=UPI0013E12F58|nr:hypothetical protein [Roseimicrobium sp. ORNL1]QIF01931.1 hypothetical protein G5S37_10450 [Roseimicrobium sp. ORNL1]